ncbi:MAG: STAS domain-containing protein [Solirubrobacterales bacterium]|nr:STAS domain-containing protein [Solirubrobacterales bacterium]
MRRSSDDPTLGGSLRPRGPIQLALSTRYEGRRIVLGVAGELDIFTVSKLVARLDDAIRRRHGDLVIDLSEAEFIDSMGLHALLNVQRRLMRQARRLIVICPPGPVRNAIELARLAEPLGVLSSAEEYRATLPATATADETEPGPTRSRPA